LVNFHFENRQDLDRPTCHLTTSRFRCNAFTVSCPQGPGSVIPPNDRAFSQTTRAFSSPQVTRNRANRQQIQNSNLFIEAQPE
jgi:hypothetical protein